jgi:hypothetical protein
VVSIVTAVPHRARWTCDKPIAPTPPDRVG